MKPIALQTIVDVPMPWILTRSGKGAHSVVTMPQNLENSSKRCHLVLRIAAKNGREVDCRYFHAEGRGKIVELIQFLSRASQSGRQAQCLKGRVDVRDPHMQKLMVKVVMKNVVETVILKNDAFPLWKFDFGLRSWECSI